MSYRLGTACTAVTAGVMIALLSGLAHAEQAPAPITAMETDQYRIEFDSVHGGLLSIANRVGGDECLKGGRSGSMPFRIFADPTEDFDIGWNEKYQLVFKDPATITRTLIEPGSCRLKEVRRDKGVTLEYEAEGLNMLLRIQPGDRPGASDWSLRITNTGTAPREFFPCFPYLDGVRLGPKPESDLATAMDQAGLVVPAWERAGGVLGESNQLSMQWHGIWDPATKSALAVIFMDPEVRAKRLVLADGSIGVHYFSAVKLAPGASYDLPPARVLVYQGDWRPAARAYRAWHDGAFAQAPLPDWYRQSNGLMGVHVKKARPGVVPAYTGQIVLDSFRDLPAAHIQTPIDNWEYAFYCRASMKTQDAAYSPHTDGDNTVREDMGGTRAMRKGFADMRRLGLHSTLYIEGFILHEESDLAKAGKNREWAVMRKDGTISCPYTKQGFYPMCAGCVEWQDHLASSVARLLRETGVDGIRLDSLGFYFLPCYNPAHLHETPFGYNEWLKTLLAKVHDAAVAVKPDVLLLTEGSADWLCPWFHGALTSRCPRDLSMMRLALGSQRPYVYASGALWGSLSGFPGGGCGTPDVHGMDWNWLCARFPAHEALVWGDIPDQDPTSSDPEIVARRFDGKGYWAVVAARPASQDPIWPRGTVAAERHADYALTVPGLAADVADAALCDIETLTWTPLAVERTGTDLHIPLHTNWALVLLRKADGPVVADFDPLPTLSAGQSTTLLPRFLNTQAGQTLPIAVTAPGLRVKPGKTHATGEVTVNVPKNALPGNYAVSITGENVLGTKRFLVVR